jgi:hypothetical protein
MFTLNLATWRDRPYVVQHCSPAELDRLRDELTRVSQDGSGRRSITFAQRRIVLARKSDLDRTPEAPTAFQPRSENSARGSEKWPKTGGL